MKNNMEKELKEFIEREFINAKYYTTINEILNCRAIAFGAMMFAYENHLVSAEMTYDIWDKPNVGFWYKFNELTKKI